MNVEVVFVFDVVIFEFVKVRRCVSRGWRGIYIVLGKYIGFYFM